MRTGGDLDWKQQAELKLDLKNKSLSTLHLRM